MRAMVFHRPGQPLTPEERGVPAPRAGEVLIRISACGVCRTDLHIVDGELVDAEAVPLLCAGMIGYRSLRMAGDSGTIGLYGFGAAAHIVAQVARHQGRQVFAFVRRGDEDARAFALSLGAIWAGWSDEPAPEPLDAAILYAPVGALVPAARYRAQSCSPPDARTRRRGAQARRADKFPVPLERTVGIVI